MLRDLLEAWGEFETRLAESRRACILLDYDGTLTPFAELPGLAELCPFARETLRLLSEDARAVVGVVSGRSLEDVRERVGLPGLWYVGNHGFEIREPGGKEHRFYEPPDLAFMRRVREEMADELGSPPGLLLELKGPVIALHYRLVPEDLVPVALRAFYRVLSRHQRALMIGRGHRVLEARLRGSCNKGTAVRLILREQVSSTLTVYFGDDVTDRDAFRALQRTGVAVCVGAEAPFADYRLSGPTEVLAALVRLEGVLRRGKPEKRRRRAAR